MNCSFHSALFNVLCTNFSCSRFSQFNAKKHIVRWLQTFWAVWTYLKDLSGRTVSLLCNSILNYIDVLHFVSERGSSLNVERYKLALFAIPFEVI